VADPDGDLHSTLVDLRAVNVDELRDLDDPDFRTSLQQVVGECLDSADSVVTGHDPP
jgi:hypothetical protein